MDAGTDLLDSPATPQVLRQLARDGTIGPGALEAGLKLVGDRPDRRRWEWFLDMLLLVLGSGFLVSGIFFFFAFNWANMHRFLKLGLLEAAVLAAVGLAFWRKLEGLPGKIALGAAGLLVGALLAVYGQIYQTGADSYQLFLLWAVLIAGWVLISQFTPLWLVWAMLFNLSLAFYWIQIIGDIDSWLYLWAFLLNGGAVLAWEIAHARGVGWLKSRWSPRVLSLPAFIALAAPTIDLVFASWWRLGKDPVTTGVAVLFLAASAATLYVYSQKILDLFMLTVCAFSLIVVMNCFVARLLMDYEILLFFVLSALFIGQAALVLVWLRRVSNAWEAKRG